MGITIDQTGFEDSDIAKDSFVEVARAFEEAVVVRRYNGIVGGDGAQGIASTETFLNIQTTANITDLQARDINYPNSIYAIGDIQAEFRIEIFGGESTTGAERSYGGRRSDRVIYRGREYKIIGHVFKVFQNYIWYFKAVLRQVVT